MKKIIVNMLAVSFLLLALCQSIWAGSIVLPHEGPVPPARPSLVHALAAATHLPSPVQNAITTATIPNLGSVAPKVALSSKLKNTLNALNKKQFSDVLAARTKLKANSPERHLINWLLITSGTSEISSREIAAMMAELSDWPGQARMRGAFERAVMRECHPAATIIALMGANQPQTVSGRVVLANALARTGNIKQAQTLIKSWWHETKLTKAEEVFVIEKLEKGLLSQADHLHRMKVMLYENRLDSAQNLSRLAEARSLYLGVAAVIKKDKNAAQQLAKVDKSWVKDLLYQFAHIQHLRRSGHYQAAAKLMLKMPKGADKLIHPDAWWVERRVLSREMLDLRQYKLAYQLVRDSAPTSPHARVDAQFHAGWYALRFLNDAKAAKTHFSTIIQLSSRPLSQARGFYWLGRAHEALKDPQATYEAYRKAAQFPTTYYGQLAAAKLGQKQLNIPYIRPTNDERAHFNSLTVMQAIKLLQASGKKEPAELLIREVAAFETHPARLAILAAAAEQKGNHYLGLKIGKEAAARGINVGALTHPIGAIPDTSVTGNKALAYAIARQESEFNPAAKSSAGARGMLQLMPKTAQSIARAYKIAYSLDKLGNDAGYNATLGSHFLQEQLARFNGSYLLTFIGYNAGSGRVNEWITRYGDPRGRNIDFVVDWVERIPFTETRNYVQRVMENYQIYQARLGGQPDIIRDLVRYY